MGQAWSHSINPDHDDVEYNAMSFVQKISYLTRKAHTSHSHYVCDNCHRTHRVWKIRNHMDDCEVVSNVGYSYFSSNIPPMEMPCQRQESADTPELKHWVGHHTNHFIPLSAHSFTGTLSHGRRAPLTGYCHRDIEFIHKLHRHWQADPPQNVFFGDPEELEWREGLAQFRTTIRPHCIRRHLKRMMNGRPQNIALQYFFTPRMIKVGEGENKKHHFMVRTTVRFDMQHARFVPLAICPHQLLNYKTQGLGEEQTQAYNSDAESSPAVWQRDLESVKEEFKSELAALAVHPSPFCFQLAVDSVVKYFDDLAVEESERLFIMSNKRIASAGYNNITYPYLSCTRCRTDFQVAGLRKENKIAITAWQDFGPEGMITDSHWQAHIPGNLLPLTEDDTETPNNSNDEPLADAEGSKTPDVASISCTPPTSRSPSPSPSNKTDYSNDSVDSEDSDIVVVGDYLTEARKTGLQPYRRKKEKKEDTDKKKSEPAVEKTVSVPNPSPTPAPAPAPTNTKVNNWKTGLTVRHVPGSVKKAFIEDACIFD